MNITIVGAGIVGLVTGVGLAHLGHQVCCVDKDRQKINSLQRSEMSLFEPDLADALAGEIKSQRLCFTHNIIEGMEKSDAVFVCVGTPPTTNGGANVDDVYDVIDELAPCIRSYTLVISKSTVPVGTARNIIKRLSGIISPELFDVVANPEFLREGSSLHDFHHPDRIVVGSDSETALGSMQTIYKPLQVPVYCTGLESAELIKYASNTFLATKLTFINQIADICEKVGADINEVVEAVGADARIGREFLAPGPGYGGMCFPKDILALQYIAERVKMPHDLLDAVIAINTRRRAEMAQKVCDVLDNNVNQKNITVFGLSFKPDTSDMREAQSIDIIRILLAKGGVLTVCDPQSMEEAHMIFKDTVRYVADPYHAAHDADVVVIITDWKQFRDINLLQLRDCMRHPRIVDMRNCFSLREVQDAGFHYVSVGRTPVERKEMR